MSIIGSINGWPLLQMPSTPGPRTVEWIANDVVGVVTSPFTAKQQTQNWQASYLEATVTMPPMTRAQAAPWIAFLLQAQGQSACFYFGDLLCPTPLGTAIPSPAPVTLGSFQGPYTLTTTGWAINQTSCLMPGDYLQVGWRLYRCMDQAGSDGAGNCSFAIWPQIRERPPNGTAVITHSPQGLFRLSTNVRRWDESYLRTFGVSFQIREAL